MGKVMNTELDEKLYNTFWLKLQQSKFDLIYYGLHFNRCTKISRGIKYTIAGVTTLATGVWQIWSKNDIIGTISAMVILVAQAISAISELFPYESRKLELRELSDELETVYLEMEDDWRDIHQLKMSNSKILETIQTYDKKQVEIKRHYFKNDSLPEKTKLRAKADEKTEEYFNYFK